MDREILKIDLLQLNGYEFFIKHIAKSHCWYFDFIREILQTNHDCIEKQDLFKKIVSTQFRTGFNSVQIVGSAKTGFSLSPQKEKLLHPFRTGIGIGQNNPSDIDIAIISDRLYNKYWHILRGHVPGVEETDIYSNIKSGIYRGFINLNDILKTRIDRKRKSDIKNLIDTTHKKLVKELNFCHPESYRIYRSWEDLQDYQTSSIYKARKNITEGNINV